MRLKAALNPSLLPSLRFHSWYKVPAAVERAWRRTYTDCYYLGERLAAPCLTP